MRGLWRGLREVDLSTHAFYAQAYLRGRPAPWQSAPPDAELAHLAGPPGRALDVGCGPGRNSLWLAQAGWQVVGLDLYPWAVRRAREAAARRGLASRASFLTAGASALDTLAPARFDLALDVLGPASDLRRRDLAGYGRRLADRLSPAGRVVLQTFLGPEELAPLQDSLRLEVVDEDPVRRWLVGRRQDG